jgi:hypothetical protein
LNKTNFTNLLVSGASTINSTLKVKGVILSEGLGIVDKSTYTNQYQLLVNPPTLTTNSTLQTIQQNVGYNQILDLQPNGGSIKLSQNTIALSNLNVSGMTTFSNKVGIGTTASTYANLDVLGVANIHNGNRFAALNYTLNPGSLILGSTALNYGGGTNWNGGNAAGLLMKCDNNTEIVVHDNCNRLASLMYYEGNTTNRLTIGRNMGWDAISSVVMNGNVTVNSSLFTTANITIGLNNSYPDLRLGSANGNHLGIAITAGAFSNSSGVNDMVVRSINKLI